MSTTRTLKVYYGYHGPPYTKHPFIRLAGKYLTEMGFAIGDEIEVCIEQHRITITKKHRSGAPRETEAGNAEAQPVRDTLV